MTQAYGEREALTSILASDEIDPLPELDLKVIVAHEVFQSDPLYDTRVRTPMKGRYGVGENPRIAHD